MYVCMYLHCYPFRLNQQCLQHQPRLGNSSMFTHVALDLVCTLTGPIPVAVPLLLLQPSPSTWSDSGLSINLDNLMGGGKKSTAAAPPKKTMNQLAATVSVTLCPICTRSPVPCLSHHKPTPDITLQIAC